MNTPKQRPRTLPPDAKIILPSQQPQRYSRELEYPQVSGAHATSHAPRSVPLAVAMGGEVLSTIVPALIIAVFIHLFLAQATRVEGYSMEPTLYGHQRLIIEKLSYRIHEPNRGDIVVVRVP